MDTPAQVLPWYRTASLRDTWIKEVSDNTDILMLLKPITSSFVTSVFLLFIHWKSVPIQDNRSIALRYKGAEAFSSLNAYFLHLFGPSIWLSVFNFP